MKHKEYIIPIGEEAKEFDEIFIGVIRKQPELIRCKDCKYYQQGKKADDWLWCMMNHHYTDDEKYCAWAERKDNGNR